ncbi:hypothetical protein [Mycolicibacterium mucogenicum]|uniref:Uncharacterized protein n=1 Tax=Mycolicibacterium mucogenicum DSM 44124 TaxID=1226753 RepID=A0A8E4W3B4_MYCMU|nr:hypothetical protein [Mycolicibacterium mucogenicum]KAB7761796.1 hypothetical protein MMUC44124_01210 [Mycolicibacterium mucogenicum DSM 44124]QPG70042.1 hypothetical protein C1S78_003170 [Mycolicibacterium mucogenicum DSM 44124]
MSSLQTAFVYGSVIALSGLAAWLLSGRAIAQCVNNEERSLAHVPGDDWPEDDWCAK